ncbi:glycoside hydrolase family 19 protein [Mycobacteroides saopaulense]|uniref:glycoside hydrolase family 19 protein n=1 Tax=Mycobacteroides saopaulense TaxID=1578165 RepID=UPI001A98A029|nr:glycoside hydrolase family 19 protein [Mycobacteroides saopaulense]
MVVYDTGRQVLDDGAKIRDFCGYWEILKRHQGELSLAGVDFSSLPMDQSGDSFDKAYYKEADINLKVIRETGDRLKDAAVGAAEQRALIAETKKLDQSLQGDAADAAQKKYEFTDEQLKANLQKLTNAQEAVQGVDDNLYFGLNKKQDEYTAAITLMIEGIIQNNPTDFENRLSTGAAVIKAGDTGSSGASPQLYAWHGSPGVNWPARQVKDDLQTTVIGAFATAIAAFNDANKSMDEFVTINYATLREALNIGAENTDVPAGFDGITEAELQQIFPTLPPDKVKEYVPQINAAMAAAGLNTPERQAAFLATCAVESGELKFMHELRSTQSANEMYGPEYAGVTFTWDTPRDADTPPNSSNPYPYTNASGQLGNTQPGDGDRFRGRGPFQLTGRSNYRRAGEALGIDLENNPELAADPATGFRIATWYYNNHSTPDGRSMNEAIDQGDFEAVTRAVNGGLTGYAERKKYFDRAVDVLSR